MIGGSIISKQKGDKRRPITKGQTEKTAIKTKSEVQV